MTKREISIISILVVSVLGLFVVQYRYLNIGLNLAKIQFQKKISIAAKEIREDLLTQNQLTFLVGHAITQDESYFNIKIDSIEDASRHFLNDFITHRLVVNGIDKEFSYRLFTKDSTDYLEAPLPYAESEKIITYPVELQGYLSDLLDKDLILELQFKDINDYFLFQLNGLTIPSLIFIGAIILVIIWTLKSFYWQRNVITTTNEFINNLTHELKTPVFSIGLATKILDKNASDTQKPILKLIQQQTERMKTHIEKVLELGALESKKVLFELKKINFAPHLEELCKDFKNLSEIENIDFKYDIEKRESYIRTEIFHLENAINNLLDNAKKYSENSIIKLKAFHEEKNLIIEIKDNGIGLSKKDKEMIFQKYYRVNQGNTHRVKGYGLGLSYVKEIMTLHSGNITLKSEIGSGTIIKITLPLFYE